ncbi:MAG: hypothetical protein AAB517_01760 [Patescibacteria group bacterium]
MTINTKVILLILTLIVAGGVGYAALTVKPAGNTVPVADIATNTGVPESLPLPPDSSLPPDSNSDLYVKGKVVSVNFQDSKIMYKPYAFNTVGSETASMSFSGNIPVYLVDNETGLSVAGARTATALSAIKPGQTIFIKVENTNAQDGKFIPQEFIISAK